jgi:hypothetical protein
MRRDSLFWGGLLVVLGGLFLLKAAGVITGDVFGYFWPLFVMALGAWILWGAFFKPSVKEGESFSIDLQGAAEACVRFNHGAGKVKIDAGAAPGQLLTGSSGLGLNYSSRLVGDMLEAKVDAGPTFFPFIGPSSGTWYFRLARDLPLTLEIDCGASSMEVDLSELQVKSFKLDTGASSTKLLLPKQAKNTVVDIDAGAASLDIRVPDGVAARIRVEQGVSALRIDPRFPYFQGGVYQSSDYDTAANRVEISLEAGAGSIDVH